MKVVVHGYRKLVKTECRVPGRILAVVGPNEAGKSSLLDAMLALQTTEPIDQAARPYGLGVRDSDVALEAWFRLDAADVEAIGQLDSDDHPVFYVVTKSYGGELSHRTDPEVRRRTTPRENAVAAIQRFSTTKAARDMEREEEDAIGNTFDAVLRVLDEGALDSTPSDEEWDQVDALVAELEGELISARGRSAGQALALWREQQGQPDPDDAALTVLEGRTPLFAKFSDADRNLQSSYVLGDVAEDPPPALRNLATLADLNLVALQAAYVSGDQGAIATATEDADAALEARLNEAWKQSAIKVRMTVTDGAIHLNVRTDGPRYNKIAEHSDGLRTFLALTAFAHFLHSDDATLILLIDEAEQHLHYDAQADLVRMLERQGVADQVVFTTHRPDACLRTLAPG